MAKKTTLTEVILTPVSPWIMVIEGISGLGKTTLADRIVRELLAHPDFDDIGWVNANPLMVDIPDEVSEPIWAQSAPVKSSIETIIDSLLPQLAPQISLAVPSAQKFYAMKQVFEQGKYLVVIDNIESVTGDPDLLPTLQAWANPSKIILTSKLSFKDEPTLFSLSLNELTQEDVFAFLRHEGKNRGLFTLAKASVEQLNKIYDVVGGNPLALKLVIGQLYALPLGKVLQNLQEARGRAVMGLYTQIFWQSWQTLSDEAKQTLLMMPLAGPKGATLDHLMAISDLEEGALQNALQELIRCSLLEMAGDIHAPRYRIHRLTETFVLVELTNWGDHVKKQS
ncbi:MAG: NB-ARC domain-containing protein [Chloroflexota bacterium]